jgi:nucleoside-diphosphate-sugar epimerase
MSSDFVRDYVHVNDVADALLMAIQSDIGGVFNVATGVGTTNLDLAGAVEPAAFEPSEPITSYSVGDPSVIHERLGWRAHRSVVADVASGAL